MLLTCTIPNCDDPEPMAAMVRQLLHGMVQVNCIILKHDKFIPLYESHVRFALDPRHQDLVLDISTLYQRGNGDCASLCCARAAQLRQSGDFATLKVYWRNQALHVEVRRADGSVEDPSRRLGMVGSLGD